MLSLVDSYGARLGSEVVREDLAVYRLIAIVQFHWKDESQEVKFHWSSLAITVQVYWKSRTTLTKVDKVLC